MLHPNFVIFGAILNFLGAFSYLLDTLKGKTKPNKVSWALWAAAPLIAFFAELQQGVGIQSLMTFMVGFSPLLVFIASFFNKNAEWKLGKLDIACGILSVVGLILWYYSKNPDVAIFFAILADGLAGVPTIVKAYIAPETENYHVFLGGAANAMITLATITRWDFAHVGFPLYILLICLLLLVLIKCKVGKLLSSK